ncbi:hypothetical protein [Paenibacillus harenae]|uniref:hypothetical protein n=1 Tax=Paenibacillus harenae TaxID=306543 RepID=UPI00279511E8|nr:hypothetical protein [Paenibacillus harenae]MDQ0058312.1 hypothetical protein [Paenibacillus harenae]
MSRSQGKWNGWSIAILILIVIGVWFSITTNPLGFILPVVILGAIFLLYKYPPSFLQGYRRTGPGQARVKQGRSSSAGKPKTTRPRSKTAPFRVIEGGKDDNDMPKYH